MSSINNTLSAATAACRVLLPPPFVPPPIKDMPPFLVVDAHALANAASDPRRSNKRWLNEVDADLLAVSEPLVLE